MLKLKLDRPLVCLDLETTGVSTKIDRIVQIGIVKLYPDSNTKNWESLVNPGIPIPPESTDIHGITDKDVESAPTFRDLAGILHTGLGGCHICGYNVDFDLRFLKAAYQREGLPSPNWYCILDVFKIFKKFEQRNLSAASLFYLGVEFEGAHKALADTIQAIKIFSAQIEKYNLPLDPEELEALINQPQKYSLDPDNKITWRYREACINFGNKFVGTPLRKVSKDYLQWILSSDFSPAVKAIVKDAIDGKFPEKKNEVS